MRKFAGLALLLLGTTALGWWAHEHTAPQIETSLRSGAQTVTEANAHPLDLRVSGRDISVRGLADTTAERDQIIADLTALPGRRVVSADLTVLPHVAPYTFEITKPEAGALTATGHAPTDAALTRLQADLPQLSAQMAHGAPAGWAEAVLASATALGPLDTGRAQISDSQVTISGIAHDQSEADAMTDALQALPEGYVVQTDVTLIDDGAPANLKLRYDASTGATLTGRHAAGLSPDTIQSILGLPALSSQASEDIAPEAVARADSEQGRALLSALAPHMGALESLSVDLSGAKPDGAATEPVSAQITLRTSPDADPDTIRSAISAALPAQIADRAAIDIARIGRQDSAQTSRTHPITGAEEHLIDGYWVGAVSPYTLSISKDPNGLVVDSGYFPSALARDEMALGLGNSAGVLRPAHGAPEGWAKASAAGAQALSALRDGHMTLTDTTLTLTGTAPLPADAAAAEQALSTLPKGYEAQTDITLLDDGAPVAFDLSYDAATGATLSGRLPKGLSAEDVQTTLGLPGLTNESVQDITDNADPEVEFAQNLLRSVAPWVPLSETLSLSVTSATAARADLTLAPGVDADLVSTAISEATPEGTPLTFTVTGTEADPEAPPATRTNALTGLTEQLSQGYWVPVRDFSADLDSCTKESADILGAFKIGFLSGSATLDAEGARSVNALASVVGPCLKAGFAAELGGHTDSTGSADLNRKLSQQRAEAVVAALALRGLPTERLTAKGYGASAPIASNDTEDGKAANRRTEVIWRSPDQ